MPVPLSHEIPPPALKRLAVIGRELRADKDEGFSPVLMEIVSYADTKACDAILFALYATDWTRQKVKRDVIDPFLAETRSLRNFGNCAVILCGETNILDYAQRSGRVRDPHGYLEAISPCVTVFLNPIHDRMTRHEMTAKRKFLSRSGRWVVSVWNRGRKYRDGKTRDGQAPPWLIFFDGHAVELVGEKNFSSANDPSIQIGILDMTRQMPLPPGCARMRR
jgi:hypothetical protein